MERDGASTPADDTHAPMPRHLVPMLARLSTDLPANERDYAFEFKWDGIRAMAHVADGHVRIETRNLNDVTHAYPELDAIAEAYPDRRFILDGEIVALGDDGMPSFSRLQRRMGVATRVNAVERARTTPATFLAFDLVHLDGRVLLSAPYEERRRLLESLAFRGSHWDTPQAMFHEGAAMMEAGRDLGLEGVMAKRIGSPYEPGRRTGAWRKIKLIRSQEFVIGGWTEGEGSRRGGIGAILVGVHRPEDGSGGRGSGQKLQYAGRVGTGFSDAMLAELADQFRSLAQSMSPFHEDPRVPKGVGVHHLIPELVAEVAFTEWTHHGTLRHPSFKGLREDKDAALVCREDPDGRDHGQRASATASGGTQGAGR